MLICQAVQYITTLRKYTKKTLYFLVHEYYYTSTEISNY